MNITNDEAMQAGRLCAELEGIIPAIESATEWSESQNSSIQYVVEIFVVLPRMFLFMHQL